MIQLSNISKEYSNRLLFNNVTISINKNEKIGFVGRNGTGKSTLFKIITGEILPDEGQITIPKMYSIGTLEQHIKFSHPTVMQECMSVLGKDEKFDNYKAEKILFGLGFTDEDLQKDPNSFSGGYQIRINLTRLLMQQPDMLLLDEPTNYLDIVSTRWLENFLRRYPGEFILITHDREFMNQVCTHTMGLNRQNLEKIEGSYSKYKLKIEEAELVYENTRLNQEKKRKEIEAFVTRFKAKASKATAAQSRQKMLDKMAEMEKLEDVSSMDFSFTYKDFTAKTLVECGDLSFGYSTEKLFKQLDFFINKGEKIAVIGKNGKGKSTLLNLIAELLNPDTGFIKKHPNVAIGHFGQTNIETLKADNTIEQEIQSISGTLTGTRIRNICGTMMFSGDDANKKIKVLSGGEKSRVLLGKILAKEANLLLLDEPTNHLDQESIDILINELKAFKGAVIIVTHSEHILKNLATKLLVFQKESCEEFHGGYEEFLEKIGWEDEQLDDEINNDKSAQAPKLNRKDYKMLRSELIKSKSKETKPLKQKIEKLEADIMRFEEVTDDANEKIIRGSENEDGAMITKYSKLLNEAEEIINTSFLELEESSELLDGIEAGFDKKLNELENL